jgi:tyrosyl-tRNA synthetase
MDLFEDLKWRGLVYQRAFGAKAAHQPSAYEHPEAMFMDEYLAREDQPARWLNEKPRTVYAGFDPTSDSLHVGSLLPAMMLRRFQMAGHRPIALVGGATGMIGDPSGKSEERNLLSVEQLQANVAGIERQLRGLLDFGGSRPALLLNNFDWMRDFSYLGFLRDVGKHFPVNMMLAKDSVKGRLDRDSGISYTEFSYMLLQAYDFVFLNREHGCELQIGGSDQWGNITAGIDLARRMHGVQLYGLTCPLLLKSDRSKMGKTEKGAIYLSADKTPVHEFYQYWFNVADDDASMCLRFLTELSREEIESLDASRKKAPQLRESQKRLAWELTRLVHGELAAGREKRASELISRRVSVSDVASAEATASADLSVMPTFVLSRERIEGPGLSIADAFMECKLAKSKSEVRRLAAQGGCYVNDLPRDNADHKLTHADLVSGTHVMLRSGKKKYAVLRFG